MSARLTKFAWSLVALLGMRGALCGMGQATDVGEDGDKNVPRGVEVSRLDRGFSGLYNLDFAGAQKDFAAWQVQHPDDPMGPVSEAAGLLFAEFNRLGVLEAQFFENDDAFVDRPKQRADPELRKKFRAAIERAENLAHTRLAKDPKDRDALFVLTLSSGLQADYASLIDKRNFASVCFTKDASSQAQKLLAVCPDCYDALLATGFSKYIVGNLIAPLRWILRMDGLPADKQGGSRRPANHRHARPLPRAFRANPAGHRVRAGER